MTSKKNPKYDLEKRRKLFLNLGFLVAGSMTLAAFKFGTPISEIKEELTQQKVLNTEIFEIKEKKEPEKVQSNFKPEPPKIFNEEKIIEKDSVPEDLTVRDIDLPDLTDITEGIRDSHGTGGGTDIIETIDMEFAESYPLFPGGGDPAMMSFIQKNFRFPKNSLDIEQGTIYVRFIVTSKGDITEVSIARGVSPELDREAMRVVQSMPTWEPAKHRGRPVNVRMVIPIKVRYF